ncbi:MAG: hypothetical protein FJ304_27690, partial [Planctomycetes bacterium]|nr:hypothetical protein [Planctomycetota bacterium]
MTTSIRKFELDGAGAKARDAVHVIFASENVCEEYLLPARDLTESEPGDSFRVVTLEALVRIDSLRNSDRWPIHRVMTNYEKLRRKPLLFRMFTGLSADEFDKV